MILSRSKLTRRVKRPRVLESRVSFLSTHIDAHSGLPTMVDVSGKSSTVRKAVAESSVWCPPCMSELFNGVVVSQRTTWKPIPASQDIVTAKKGSVLATAVIAGTMAAKQTSSLIPFCHPLPLESCHIECRLERRPRYECCAKTALGVRSTPPPSNNRRRKGCWHQLLCRCTVATSHKTGVEMEAMVGASVAALTIYDMLKGSHRLAQANGLHVGRTLLLQKSGGKTDFTRRPFLEPKKRKS